MNAFDIFKTLTRRVNKIVPTRCHFLSKAIRDSFLARFRFYVCGLTSRITIYGQCVNTN